MVFLLFQIGADRYGIEISRVEEVLPRVGLKTIPQAPPGVAGVFNYHGSPVPVIDLSALALGRPAHGSLSTRLVVVNYPTDGGEPRLLGLLAEMATRTARFEREDFREPGIGAAGAPYLGPVADDGGSLVQWVRVEQLLTPEIGELLWRQAGEAA